MERLARPRSCDAGRLTWTARILTTTRRHAASRIIPARAGSTCDCFRRCFTERDHPRSRGEHADSAPEFEGEDGSSPLARGAPLHVGHRQRCRRIIPARAGSTRPYRERMPRSGDHPRSRGEHSRIAARASSSVGSSPLARGAHCCGAIPRGRNGIIPARAGSTPVNSNLLPLITDHPRSRGEHSIMLLSISMVAGSSPLARGAPARFGAVGR